MKQGAQGRGKPLEASLISKLAVSFLASSVHDRFEDDRGAVEYYAK